MGATVFVTSEKQTDLSEPILYVHVFLVQWHKFHSAFICEMLKRVCKEID
jgi:hypothetical protein